VAGVSFAGPELLPLSKGAKASLRKAIEAARTAVSKGDAAETVGALETALTRARAEAPLEVRRVVAVQRPQRGLGVYEPLKNKKIEFRTLWLYVEVANFGHRPTTVGKDEVVLTVMGEFFDGEGASIGSRGLGTHRFETRTRSGVTSFGLDVRLGDGAPKGAYGLELTVTDEVSGKKGAKRVEFVIP
jgi:hypothetical protein